MFLLRQHLDLSVPVLQRQFRPCRVFRTGRVTGDDGFERVGRRHHNKTNSPTVIWPNEFKETPNFDACIRRLRKFTRTGRSARLDLVWGVLQDRVASLPERTYRRRIRK